MEFDRAIDGTPRWFSARYLIVVEFLFLCELSAGDVHLRCCPSAGDRLLWMSNMWNGTQSVGECSSSTSLSSQQDLEDDRMIALVLSEEYAQLDGGVARRLSNLAPVPVRSHTLFFNFFSYR